MPQKQSQEESSQAQIKNLEIQCLFLTKQLKQLVSKRAYRTAIQKTEKIFISHSSKLHQVCASIFIRILSLETKALVKLLQRNLYKKYQYADYQVKRMARIINRNNFLAQTVLVAKIQSKQILDDDSEALFIQDSHIVTNLFKNDFDAKTFQKLTLTFCQNYLASVNVLIMNFKNYQLNLDKWSTFHEAMHSMADNCPKFSFKVEFSTISLKMITCRFLFEKGALEPCLKLTDKVIESLLNLHYSIRVCYENIESNEHISANKKLQKTHKKKYYLKKVIKMLLVALIVMIRVNMQCGYQDIVVEGINLFNYVIEKADPQLNHFKKYLNPQVYIFQQFFQYRAQKFQIKKIIQPIFLPQLNELINNLPYENKLFFDTRQTNPMIEFYNQKMTEFHNKMSMTGKKLKLKRTANAQLFQSASNSHENVEHTKKIGEKKKRETNRSGETGATHWMHSSSHSSQIFSQTQCNQKRASENTLFNMEKLIVDDLEKANLAFLSQRQKSSKNNGIVNSEIPNNNNNCDNTSQNLNEAIIAHQDSSLMSRNQSADSHTPLERFQSTQHLKIGTHLISNFIQKKTSKFTPGPHHHFVNSPTHFSTSNKTNHKKKPTTKQAAQNIIHIQNQMTKQLKSHLELLKNKKNQKINNLFQVSSCPVEDFIHEQKKSLLERQISAQTFIQHKSHELQERGSLCSQPNVNIRCSLEPKNQKDKLKFLNKKSKLQMFIELLVKNKEYLGIKKWSEKIEYLKKKDELKEKVRVTRKTTSINCKVIPGLSSRMTFLAGNILKFSLEEIEQFMMNSSEGLLNKNQVKAAKIDNENNYRLGQKSIQMLMNKLEREKEQMIKKEKEVIMRRDNRVGRENIYRMKSAHTCRVSRKESGISNGGSSLRKYWNVNKEDKKSLWMCKFVL